MQRLLCFGFCIGIVLMAALGHAAPRLRLIIETDAGGDPDDEQSLVRFLLYANEWDVEGIIANREQARDGENLNTERTGLGIVRQLLDAYGQCHSNLVQHDLRYPTREQLWSRTVAGYDNTDEAVQLILRVIDAPDKRPIWYSDWGTDTGGATNNLKRALDRVLREHGSEAYAKFKNKLRLTSYDLYGEHTTHIPPPFPLWVNTFQPEMNRRRWYHRFSAITGSAGGFDAVRDMLTSHGPLGALYPTNTTHWLKEGDSTTFLYLVPTGMNDPEHPEWGSWAGRYGLNTNYPGKPYYWANQFDGWNGTTNRDNTLARWAAHLQNDFRARLDWCVREFKEANHAPDVRITGQRERVVKPGDRIVLDASASKDPDGDDLRFEWRHYPEPTSYSGPAIIMEDAKAAKTSIVVPSISKSAAIHLVVIVTDEGDPPLTRYGRVILQSQP